MMKKLLLLIICFCSLNALNAQTIVSTSKELRNIVLEEYTGIHCVNCPQGHQKAEYYAAKHPGRMTIINIHQGYFANPNNGEPDYRTVWGDALANLFSVTSYPRPIINRIVFTDNINRGDYVAFCVDSLLDGSYSPVNIAAKTKWDETAKELEIYVEVYLTETLADIPLLNIAFLESGIPGPQSGAAELPYIHNHMLRDLIAGQWGEQINDASKGTFFSKTYKYKPNTLWNIDSCTLALFITPPNKKNTYTGIELTAIPPNFQIQTTDNNDSLASKGAPFTKAFNIKNISEKEVKLNLKIGKSSNTPSDWTVSSSQPEGDFVLAPKQQIDFSVSIEPQETIGIGDAIVEIKEIENLKNPVKTYRFTSLSSNLEYAEINSGSTSINNIKSIRPKFVSVPESLFTKLNYGMKDLKTLVWNFGQGGGLTTSNADLMQNLLNNGVRILVNGSAAIPKLALENSQHSLLNSLGFTYTKGSEIIGNTYNLNGVSGDPIGNGLNISNLTRVDNGGFLQAMTITDDTKAFPVFKTSGTEKLISIRSQLAASRAVCLNFAIDAVTDPFEKSTLLEKSFSWLEGTTIAEEKPKNTENSLFTIFTNPLTHNISFIFDLPQRKSVIIDLFDLNGSLVANKSSAQFEAGITEVNWNPEENTKSKISRGVYLLRVIIDLEIFYIKLLLE